MRVTIRLFAHLRLLAGVSSVPLELPPGATVGAALDRFFAEYPGLRDHRPSTLAAVGLEYAPPEQIRYMDTKRGRDFAHLTENMEMRGEILEIARGEDGDFAVWPVPVRPLPEDDSWFENTWREWASGEVFAPEKDA